MVRRTLRPPQARIARASGKAAFGDDDIVAVAVEGPDGQVHQPARLARIAAPGDRRDRGEALGSAIAQRQLAWPPRLRPAEIHAPDRPGAPSRYGRPACRAWRYPSPGRCRATATRSGTGRLDRARRSSAGRGFLPSRYPSPRSPEPWRKTQQRISLRRVPPDSPFGHEQLIGIIAGLDRRLGRLSFDRREAFSFSRRRAMRREASAEQRRSPRR